MYFCKKLICMKKSVLFILAIFMVGLLSSCGVYKKPCEGVTTIKQQTIKRLSNYYQTKFFEKLLFAPRDFDWCTNGSENTGQKA